MTYVRPEVGDIGIIEHYAFNDAYVIVKVSKVTAARLQIMALQTDGDWGIPQMRAVGQFMFLPENTATDDLLAIRAELAQVAKNTRATIEQAKKNGKAAVAMLAAQGKVPSK